MLCAKYDYKMDIAVKQEEAFQDGKEAGAHNKAIEDATEFLKENISPEIIAKCVKLPLDEVLALKNQQSGK